MNKLKISLPQNLKCEDKLIAVRDLLGAFTRKNHSILASLVIDVISGDRQILKFIMENFTSYIQMISSIIDECKKDGILEALDTFTLMISFLVPIIAPNDGKHDIFISGNTFIRADFFD